MLVSPKSSSAASTAAAVVFTTSRGGDGDGNDAARSVERPAVGNGRGRLCTPPNCGGTGRAASPARRGRQYIPVLRKRRVGPVRLGLPAARSPAAVRS